MNKYRMYIDECGNPGLESSENPNHRYLSLTGIIIDLEYASEIIHPQMESLKKIFFDYHPDEPVVLHRKEMINHINAFHVLKNDLIRSEFDVALLDLLNNWEYKVISICIDKKSHKEKYMTWRYDPYHYCLAVMLERYYFFLKENNFVGDVMSESRGGKEDRRLKDSFEGLLDNGTDYIACNEFRKYLTSKQLKVKPKQNNIAGLQLADLIAHPSRNEILNENNLLSTNLAHFAQKVIEILRNKYYRRKGVINGYGKKLL